LPRHVTSPAAFKSVSKERIHSRPTPGKAVRYRKNGTRRITRESPPVRAPLRSARGWFHRRAARTRP